MLIDPSLFNSIVQSISDQLGVKVKTASAEDSKEGIEIKGETADNLPFEGLAKDNGDWLCFSIKYGGVQYNWST